MKVAGNKGLTLSEGVTLSGTKDCKRITFWRSSLNAGAEGAKRFLANLSGKRTENIK